MSDFDNDERLVDPSRDEATPDSIPVDVEASEADVLDQQRSIPDDDDVTRDI